MLLLSIVVGLLFFLVETSFVVVLQLFLFSIGLISSSQLMVPGWLPTTQNFSVALLFMFGLVRGLIYMLKSYLAGIIGQEFIKEQRTRTIEYGLSFATNVSTNQIVTIFTERIAQGGSYLSSFSQLILVLTSSCLFFLTGLKIAHFEMLIGVSILAIFLFPLRYFNKNIKQTGDGLRDEWNFVSSTLISGLKNNFFLRVYNLVDSEIMKSIKSLGIYLDHYRNYFKVSTFKNFLPQIMGIFVVSAITLISLKYIHTKGIVLVAFFYLFIRFSQNMSEASASLSDLTLNQANILELYNLFLLHKKHKQIAKTENHSNLKKTADSVESITININGLAFSYNGCSPFLFKDLSAQVSTGEVLLIKGPSGVGKSTLLMLIFGMLKPNQGEVLINNINVCEFDRSISQFIGYVGPEPYLIIGSLKDNLLFGHEFPKDVSDNELNEVLRLVCLDLVSFPLDLQIMEHVSLSTGQKQRLSIARALLRKPKLLIFDEATANLDKDTEEQILNNLKSLIANMTTIVISHKSSFDAIATTTLNLENKLQRIT